MSRIGKLPISVPAGVTISIKDNIVTVKGPKGELSQDVNPDIKVEIKDGEITFLMYTTEMSVVAGYAKRILPPPASKLGYTENGT